MHVLYVLNTEPPFLAADTNQLSTHANEAVVDVPMKSTVNSHICIEKEDIMLTHQLDLKCLNNSVFTCKLEKFKQRNYSNSFSKVPEMTCQAITVNTHVLLVTLPGKIRIDNTVLVSNMTV